MAELALESYGGVLLFNLRLHFLAQARAHARTRLRYGCIIYEARIRFERLHDKFSVQKNAKTASDFKLSPHY